ncbi:helix-turn-helix domain-containing protein [Halovulum sp. GXIMD14793]
MLHLAPLPAFHKRLRRLRRVAGLKQEALADLLSVNQTSISRWESGAQLPDPAVQQKALALLTSAGAHDAALKRLVETSPACLHLVEEANHICLTYSKSRAQDWDATDRSLIGTSLWPFATDEIRTAEAELEDHGWWEDMSPAPKAFITSGAVHPEIRISAGGILWERVYLSDGTPARLVSGLHPNA